MIYQVKKIKQISALILCLLIFITSVTLGIHNATLYNPRHGFDGEGHLYYIKYIYKNWKIPKASTYQKTTDATVEDHQSPLYYFLGAVTMLITGHWKTAQYINSFVLWLIIGVVGLGLYRVFRKIDQVLIGMFSLAALPMLNIFPAMITNELFNTFWIISGIISCFFIIKANKPMMFWLSNLWFCVSVIFGIWTKVSIIIIIPLYIFSLFLNLREKKIKLFVFLSIVVSNIALITFFSFPIIQRAKEANSGSNVIRIIASTPRAKFKPLQFYTRIDWVFKIDMYNTQYYSMLGGAWNSFWTDGHNAITPFVKFHKKSFILWSLGFILLPTSLYGLNRIIRKDKKIGILLVITGIEMLGIYIYYNLNSHYSAARLTYEMGIVVPYAFGIASAFENKKLKLPIFILLLVQFTIMVSFFQIQGWWHVTK